MNASSRHAGRAVGVSLLVEAVVWTALDARVSLGWLSWGASTSAVVATAVWIIAAIPVAAAGAALVRPREGRRARRIAMMGLVAAIILNLALAWSLTLFALFDLTSSDPLAERMVPLVVAFAATVLAAGTIGSLRSRDYVPAPGSAAVAE